MTTTAATETAITIPILEVEPLVGRYRHQLDRSATWGVPAHVTVLYPFVAPSELDQEVLAMVGAVAARLPVTDAVFREVRWFDRRVVYLAPEPEPWFRVATAAMAEAFPQCPPYGGVFDDVVPHLTVGAAEDVAALEAAASSVSAQLPASAHIDRLWVMQGTDAAGSWSVVREFPLRGN